MLLQVLPQTRLDFELLRRELHELLGGFLDELQQVLEDDRIPLWSKWTVLEEVRLEHLHVLEVLLVLIVLVVSELTFDRLVFICNKYSALTFAFFLILRRDDIEMLLDLLVQIQLILCRNITNGFLSEEILGSMLGHLVVLLQLILW